LWRGAANRAPLFWFHTTGQEVGIVWNWVSSNVTDIT
jgi:hypothetical protein